MRCKNAMVDYGGALNTAQPCAIDPRACELHLLESFSISHMLAVPENP